MAFSFPGDPSVTRDDVPVLIEVKNLGAPDEVGYRDRVALFIVNAFQSLEAVKNKRRVEVLIYPLPIGAAHCTSYTVLPQ